MLTIDEAYAYGRFQLNPSPTAELDARLLLEATLDCSYSYLLAHGEETLTAVSAATYRQRVARARQFEPIPYILGTAPFFDFALTVTPDVLIPRPETEMLVEIAVAWAKNRGELQLVDVGTGSGCIPIAIARQNKDAHITAVDISPAAIAIAKKNSHNLAPRQIQFICGDLLNPIPFPIDLLTANLPYVTNSEWTQLHDGVKLFEPSLALIGGDDGLDLIRRLLQQASTKLKKNGLILLEIGWQQGLLTKQLAHAHFPSAQVDIIQDYAGHDRLVRIINNCVGELGN